MVKVISSYLSMVFNDENLNRQEKEVLLLLKSFDKDDSNSVQVKIKTLITYMDTTNGSCLRRTLKSLKSKRYLDIEVGIGRSANVYKLIKDYKIDCENICGAESLTRNMTNDNKFVSANMGNNDELVTTKMISDNESVDTNRSCNDRYDTTKHDIDNNINKYNKNNYINNNNISNKENNNYINNSSNSKNVISNDIGSGTSSHNNNYVNNTLEDVFINILKHWNNQSISSVLQLDLRIRDSITLALRKYSFESIIKAISNYSKVYYSSYFYNIKWNLSSFLTSQKGIDKFHDKGCMWQKYNEHLYQDDVSFEDVIIDKYSYIDV
ncbi:hypothetical protein [Clostridium saudiense]|uniref:hypothetical protein n=1 Tax=Clostridium saudiense TaxID=1414720 RepID=UPI0018AC8901|nr:hypothetical protein [Clostridium saudiense]